MEGLFVILIGLLIGVALAVFILKKKKILTSASETAIFITFVLAVLLIDLLNALALPLSVVKLYIDIIGLPVITLRLAMA